MGEYQNPDILVPGLYKHGFLEAMPTGELYVTLPERIAFLESDDNALYVAAGGEYLHQVVQRAYGSTYEITLHIVEVVAQFQPNPILDISTPLAAGQHVIMPSTEFIENYAYGESLADSPEL